MADKPIFSRDEHERLRRLTEQERQVKFDREAKALYESESYRPVLEKIQADRETHQLLLTCANLHKENILELRGFTDAGSVQRLEAICIQPFERIHAINWALQWALSPDLKLQEGLYQFLGEVTPDLYLHITPEKSQFAIGCLFFPVTTNNRLYAAPVNVVCDFLRNCHKYSTEERINPKELIPRYKAVVEEIFEVPVTMMPVAKDIPLVRSDVIGQLRL